MSFSFHQTKTTQEDGLRFVMLLGAPLFAAIQTGALFFVLGFVLFLARRELPRSYREEAMLLPFAVFVAATFLVQFAIPWAAAAAVRCRPTTRIYYLSWLLVVFAIWGFDIFGLWRMETNIGHQFWLAWTFSRC